jgi:hypothetical protein
MATLQTALQTSQPSRDKIIVYVESWMPSWAETRGMKSVEGWLNQLLEAERAAARLHERKWYRGGNEPAEGESVNIESSHKLGPPRALAAEQETELVEMFEIGDANAPTLARRFNIGVSTVKRILRRAGAM